METLQMPLAAVEKQVQVTRHELETLARLLGEARIHAHGTSRRDGPTNAVMGLLRQQPRQLGEIVELLKNTVETRAKDVRKTLYTTILTLKRNERIKKREDGLLTIA